MASVDAELLLKCIENTNDCEQIVNNIVTEIKDGKKELLWVVERLETQLVDNDVSKRLKGIEVLTQVICLLPTEHLKSDEIQYISSFLCVKLKDHHSLIPPILQGLLSIVKMPQLASSSLNQIVDSLSIEVQSQLQSPKDRMVIYQLLQILLSTRLADLKELGTRFVFAVIGLVDAECNARNLTLVFTLLPRLLTNFTLGHLAEDMFEALACYFPIDVPTEGPDVIAREVLSELLENCLTCTSELAPFVLALLLEKLDSELTLAKKDALSLLQRACMRGTWGAKELEKDIKSIGFSIHREASRSDELAVRGQQAATAVVKALSSSALSVEQVALLPSFIKHVTNMNQHALQQVEMRGFVPACSLMASLARGSYAGASLVCEEVVPTLVSQFQARPAEQQVHILAALTDILSAHSSTKDLEKWSCKDLYFEAAVTSQPHPLREQGFAGLKMLAKVLTADDRGRVYSLLQDTLATPDLGNGWLKCFCTFAESFPEEMINTQLFESLFQNKGDLGLQALCAVAVHEPFLSRVVPRLLEMCVSQELQLPAIKAVQQLAESETSVQYLCSECCAIQKLTHYWLNQQPITSEESVQALEATATLLSMLVRSQSTEQQSRLLEEFLDQLGLNHLGSIQGEQGSPSSPQQAAISLGIVSSLRRDVSVPNLSPLLCLLVRTAMTAKSLLVIQSCSFLAACLLNKAPLDFDVDVVLDLVLCKDVTSLELHTRLTRALLLRGHTQLNKCMDNVIINLSDIENGPKAVEAFKLLITEENKFLCYANHAYVSVLHKQRLATYLPKMHKAYEAQEEHKDNLLLAMAQIAQNVQKVILEPYLPMLVKMLVQSLHSTSSTLLQAALECLEPLLVEKNPEMQSYISDIVNSCLNLASSSPDMRVRIGALQCIADLTVYQASDIIPLRVDVLEGVRCCLDDRKRLVRRAAVRAMGRWQLLS